MIQAPAGLNIAVIPARGGSKRIPRKNIREFAGKPMIAWSIETAMASGCICQVRMYFIPGRRPMQG